MQYTYYVYKKDEANLTINRMPVWFKEVQFEGNEQEGIIILHSHNDYDEYWGSNAKMEISWEPKKRIDFLHYKEVQRSIDVYNAINMVITNKENDWVRSHEFTFWYGNRSKMIRKRYYAENAVHGIFYCDISERLFSLHTNVIAELYENFRPYVIESYKSIICH
ncbi:MAG: hypothetical protein ACQERB_03125 [Promethearchaeati archaeon]|nr:MAG: hypothetical protein EU518_00615 [Candidatus Lokiarchaeota archaeon]